MQFNLLTADSNVQLKAGIDKTTLTADPQSIGSYQNNVWNTYDGYAMAVIRSGIEVGQIKVVLSVEGCETEEIELDVI